MNQTDRNQIRKEIDEYYTDCYYSDFDESSGFKTRLTCTDNLHKMSPDLEYVRNESDDEFEEIKKTFVIPKEDKEYFGRNNFMIDAVPYHSNSVRSTLYSTKRITEGFELEYYAGESLEEAVFMGLTYAIELYYNKNLKDILATNKHETIKTLKDISDTFWNLDSYNPIIQNKKYTKEYKEGIEDPFWDEYSRVEDTSYTINMRFFKLGTDTTEFSEFLDYAHNKVKQIDAFLENHYSINQTPKAVNNSSNSRNGKIINIDA